MNILHLPTSTGGNAWGLSQAERSLGHNSQVLIADPNPFEYQADIKVPTNFQENSRFPAFSNMRSGLRLLHRFLKIRSKYDVFHFNFGKTLLDFPSFHLNLLDLPYYPKKSRIVVTYNGCDARQKSGIMNQTSMSACHHDGCYNGVCLNPEVEKRKKQNIQKFSRHARHIFALNPDLMYFLPREKTSFLPYTIHSWNDNHQVYKRSKDSDKITIVHAPSQPVAKGTPYLLKSIEILQREYPDSLEFILIQNIPYQEALKIYQKADLIIDQLLIGWYGAFAVEAMSMGKPVAAFIREEDLQFIPDKMADDLRRSVFNISIHSIEDQLRYILENPEILKVTAGNGIRYARTWHDPIKIAREALSFYQ